MGFGILLVKSVNYGLKRIHVLGPKLLESLPNDLKDKESLDSFKTVIKKLKPKSGPCLLFKSL